MPPTSDEHWDKLKHHVSADRFPFASDISGHNGGTPPEPDPEPDPPVPADAPRPVAPPNPFPGEPGDAPAPPRPPEREKPEPLAAFVKEAVRGAILEYSDRTIRVQNMATMLLVGCATLVSGMTRALAYLQPGDLDGNTKAILSRELGAAQRMLDAEQPPQAG
jgi:hypothetical protein